MTIYTNSLMNPFIKNNIKKQLRRELADAINARDYKQVNILKETIDSLDNCFSWNELFIVR